jgi:hypothetical protein
VARTAFRAKYGTNGVLVGPYTGKLGNSGESVELVAPDNPQTTVADFGLVPYVMIDKVVYSPLAPWPVGADGTGLALQRLSFTSYGNDPSNWAAAAPSVGGSGVLDTDNDGIPDDWEEAHGMNKLVNDAALDPDLDGFTNLQEYIAGTDPRFASSRLRLESVAAVAGGIEIRFQAVAGRTYSVLYCDALGAGGWQKLADVPAQAASQFISVSDSAPLTQGQRYYRLVTPGVP